MKSTKNSVVGITTLLALLSSGSAFATAPSANEIIKKSLQAARSQSEESIYVMRLIGREGEEGVRKMNVWYRSKAETDFSLLIKFNEPANIRGTGFLSVVEKGKDPNQWLYLPALKKTRRIASGGSNESFLGSDFSMADLSVDPHHRFQFQVVGEKKCGESDCYLLEGKPTDENESPYSKKVMQIRKDSYLNVYSEFYNKAGQLEKVMNLAGIHPSADHRLWADKIEMSNVLTGHKTIIEYEKRDTQKVPSDSTFSKSFLERQ